MTRMFRLLFSAVAVFILQAGCVASDLDTAVASSNQALIAPRSETLLRAGDRLQITVYGEDGLSGAFEVPPSGAVQLPLAGAVAAAGETPGSLGTKIAAALRRKYLRDPKVTVAVLSVSPFYVLGEVEKPGEYPFRNGLNLWRALAVAGGQTYRASTGSILLQHAGEARTSEVDLSQDDVIIQPGDLIRVPERWF